MTHTHLIFVVLLLLLFSPSLLCSDAEAKIFGGEKTGYDGADLGIVRIYLSVNGTKDGKPAEVSRLCGGSAIKPFVILTSLYCMNLYGSKEWKEGSEHNITVSFADYRRVTFSLSFDNITVINHDSFYDPKKNKTGSLNIMDMALVFLPKNLAVRLATLSSVELPYILKLKTQVFAAGWGLTTKGGTSFPTELMNMVQSPKQTRVWYYRPFCRDFNKPLHDEVFAEEDYICVFSASGPCDGDYGGPVFYKELGDGVSLIQAGILIETTGRYCVDGVTKKYFPVLKVGKFTKWIDANLKKNTVSSSGVIFFSPVLLGLSALVSLFLL